MNLTAYAITALERAPTPDPLLRAGVDFLVSRAVRRLRRLPADAEKDFASEMERYPIALCTQAANEQHYELPPGFFELFLGPRRKYSCCLYDLPDVSLDLAEARALDETIEHAALADGQKILELGCGWGALTLRMAERFPQALITAVSNSQGQRSYIEKQAQKRGLENLRVLTADMNDFSIDSQFDRIVSIEMFEHMANWRKLLLAARSWLEPHGCLFLHVFAHRNRPYRFDAHDKNNWIAQHFFTGGVMPSHGLIRSFGDLFTIEREWRWSGRHYERTAMDWLSNFDANREAIDRHLVTVYGNAASLWRTRWRLFFFATAGLFGSQGGEEWGVSHFLLRPTQNGSRQRHNEAEK